jgi:hypothetical protein
MVNDKQTAGSNYIITFYKEIEELTHNFAVYTNVMLEIKQKYGDDLSKVEEDVKTVILKTVQAVRIGLQKSYVQYVSIKSVLKLDSNNIVEDLYNTIKKQFVIKIDDLELYVIAINTVLVNDIIQSLLNTSNDLLQSMYKDE